MFIVLHVHVLHIFCLIYLYFILFAAVENSIAFQISISKCWFLVYRNTIDINLVSIDFSKLTY